MTAVLRKNGLIRAEYALICIAQEVASNCRQPGAIDKSRHECVMTKSMDRSAARTSVLLQA